MPRRNRISVHDGIYHVSTRIAHKAMLLESDEVKDDVLRIVYDAAAFSGVDVCGAVVMDNHFHLLVHVPPVPARHWLDPSTEPCAYAFGMRPPERNAAIWSDRSISCSATSSPAVDCPPPAGDRPTADCPSVDAPPPPPPGRAPLDFWLSDSEMLDRIKHLYPEKTVRAISERWRRWREAGLHVLVNDAKAAYCRRMYNLSQFVKTVKETVSRRYNEKHGHSGCLWQGRFYSGLVEKDDSVLAVVAAYIAYNPVKAGIARSASGWCWSSYALAVRADTEQGRLCRRMYEELFSRPWEEVRAMLESIFADGLPDGVTAEDLKRRPSGRSGHGESRDAGQTRKLRASQVIRVSMWIFSRAAYVGRDFAFSERVRRLLPSGFPCEGPQSILRCMEFSWELPPRRAA